MDTPVGVKGLLKQLNMSLTPRKKIHHFCLTLDEVCLIMLRELELSPAKQEKNIAILFVICVHVMVNENFMDINILKH